MEDKVTLYEVMGTAGGSLFVAESTWSPFGSPSPLEAIDVYIQRRLADMEELQVALDKQNILLIKAVELRKQYEADEE